MMPIIIGVAVVAVLGVGLLVILGGDKDDGAGQAAASDDVESKLAEAEAQAERGEFDAAGKTLAGIRGQLDGQPGLSGRVERLDAQINVGRLLATAKKLDEAGKVEAAIAAYEEVLAADKGNAEARERLADLRATPDEPVSGPIMSIKSEPVADLIIDGTPTGTTPFDQSLSLGKHEIQIAAEGYETWTQTIEVKETDNLPISVKLTPQSKKSDRRPGGQKQPVNTSTTPTPTPTEPPKKDDNPFLPTSKDKKNDGPFLPTEK
jgi:hypothetical protein